MTIVLIAPDAAWAPSESSEVGTDSIRFAITSAPSTMPPAGPADVDEDDIVIEAFRRLAADHPKLLLVLVPRRPNRFDEAAAKLEAAGI